MKIFGSNRGISLFIAVTIMGILLLISYAVVNITIKGTQFATSGRDSQYAYYAAESGIECAEYWDAKNDVFATTTAGTILRCGDQSNIVGGQSMVSFGTSTNTRIGGGGDTNQTSVFGLTFAAGTDGVGTCAVITVRKYYQGSILKTYIKSRGYNTCAASSRRVERGIEVSY